MLLNGHGRGAATGRASCSAEEQVEKRGYIVIVETDDLIRGLLERWLGEAGYAVVAAAAGPPGPEQPVRRGTVNISYPPGAPKPVSFPQAGRSGPNRLIFATLVRRPLS